MNNRDSLKKELEIRLQSATYERPLKLDVLVGGNYLVDKLWAGNLNQGKTTITLNILPAYKNVVKVVLLEATKKKGAPPQEEVIYNPEERIKEWVDDTLFIVDTTYNMKEELKATGIGSSRIYDMYEQEHYRSEAVLMILEHMNNILWDEKIPHEGILEIEVLIDILEMFS